MSLYTEIQQAIEDVLNAHGIDTDEAEHLPQTLDELRARTPTIQDEFRQVLEDAAAAKRDGR